jgi:photosystem II stability/assembly factor-like uncharacterized protein
MLTVFSSDPTLEYSPSSSTKILIPIPIAIGTIGAITPGPTATTHVEPVATNIIFQSIDGGQTWQDISQGLPEQEQPEGFFAGESGVYLRVKNVMYHSGNNLNTPDWEKENGLDPRSSSITFNRSGVIAYNYEGQIYQKVSSGTWRPKYANFRKHSMRTLFETSNGTVFLGYDHGLYKSADGGQSWKQVQNEGWAMEMVESEGVLVATGQKGIMRSTDYGEHWEWVISEGGVGIAVERIDGGFAAIAFNTSTKSRRIHISLDRGETWKAIDDGLPPSLSISSIKQMGRYLICGHPDGIFRSSDMGKTWIMVHPGVNNPFDLYVNRTVIPSNENRKVFKIYVSGKVLYAVAGSAGC